MTTIQPHSRWVPRKFTAAACIATCMLLFATAAQAGTLVSSPIARNSATPSPTARRATTARAAAARTLASQTRDLHTCMRLHPGHCAAARRAVERAARGLSAAQAQPASFGSESPTSTKEAPESPKESLTPTKETPTLLDEAPAKAAPVPAEAPAKEAPAPAEESPSQGSTTFQPGINSGSAAIWELPGAELLGAKIVRVATSVATTPKELEPVIAAYAEQGIRVAPLATFTGTLPTPAQAQNLAAWASAFGPGGTFWANHAGGQYAIQTIEFGNETSDSYQYTDNTPAGYASRAQTYALRFAEAATAVRAVNPKVGLLALGDSGNAGPAWVENMFKAVPNLGTLVAGWTVHPYGPNWRAKFEEIVSQTAAQGAPSTIPIDVTEWGLSTDNGRCLSENYGWNPCMTYQEAAELLARTISEMRQALPGRLGLLLLYQIRDQKPSGETTGREDYFGAAQRELQPKGAYTTEVKEVLASS